MNQHNEISTLQYVGSKARIISHICDPIIKNNSIKTVVDLFAGTGSVGYALKGYKNIISNDIEHYAFIINQAILNGCNFSAEDEAAFFCGCRATIYASTSKDSFCPISRKKLLH